MPEGARSAVLTCTGPPAARDHWTPPARLRIGLDVLERTPAEQIPPDEHLGIVGNLDQPVAADHGDPIGVVRREDARGGDAGRDDGCRSVLDDETGPHHARRWRFRYDADGSVWEANARCIRRGPLCDHAQDPTSGVTARRLRPVLIENHRVELGLQQLVRFEYRPQDDARERGKEILIEDEVAQAVRDQRVVVPLGPLEHVGMVANDEVGAGIHGSPGRPGEELRCDLGELESPVDLDDDEVGPLVAKRRNVLGDTARPEERSTPVAATGHPVLQFRKRICDRQGPPELVPHGVREVGFR